MATGLRSTLSIVAALAFGLTACGSDENESSTNDEQSTASADTIMISGNLTYLERVALEPGSTATVTLEDILNLKADSSATLIAEQVIGLGDQQVPIPFELTTDAAGLDDRFSYSVRATITGPDGELTTDTVNLIDPSETSIVVGDLVMVRVEGG